MTIPQPLPQHLWLQRLLGDWTYELPPCEPGQPVPGPARETTRAIGGLWIQSEGEFSMPGGTVHRTIMTLGFNPATGRFQGTWIGSMMNHLWIYDGELNPGETALTLFAEGPAFDDPSRTAQYKDVIELLPDGNRKLSSHCQQSDGSWRQFMETVYHRV